MKKHKMILILLSVLMLMGCGESEIVDERGETTNTVSIDETDTTNETDKYVEAEYYNGYSSFINVEYIEIVNGEKKYATTYYDLPTPVTDGELQLRVTFHANYTFDEKLVDNENIYSIFLYHNGNLHKFNVENSDTYMYTVKAKNGKVLDIEISFKVTDDAENYQIVGISYNNKYKKCEYGEYNIGSPSLVAHKFMLDLSENTKLYEDEDALEVCTSYNIDKDKNKLVNEVKEYTLVSGGYNSEDEFVYKTSDRKYKFGVIRMSENQDYMANYTTFIVCDNEIIPAFDGKTIMNYKGQGDISLIKEINLNMPKGEHVVYSVTIADKGESYRSRFVHFNVE